jgi:1-acyl-sn-glycerol-3-phosphate acyltransferase
MISANIVKIKKAVLLVCLNVFFIILGLVVNAAIFVSTRSRMKAKAFLTMLWARCSCSILGVRVECTGSYKKSTAYFIVSNHCSYIDILVLAGIMPSVFVSKKEVSSWVFLGWLTRLAGTIFINRESMVEAADAISGIRKRLECGVSVVVFPEGTTNDGDNLRGFKSALFEVPADIKKPVLPISLYYPNIAASKTKDIAWYGDMKFLPHIWNLLGLNRIISRIHFNPAICNIQTSDRSQGRKILSSFSYESISTGINNLRAESGF